MNASYKENLNTLSKEQLLYLVERYHDSMRLISEICVEESKQHIESDRAVDKIRKEIYFTPCMYDSGLMREMIGRQMDIIAVRAVESEE